MEKKELKKSEKNKDKKIEVVYTYKEIHTTAQNALERYLSNLNKKA